MWEPPKRRCLLKYGSNNFIDAPPARIGRCFKQGTKEVERCYAVSFDYDDWQRVVNNKEKHKLPNGAGKITIEIEEG